MVTLFLGEGVRRNITMAGAWGESVSFRGGQERTGVVKAQEHIMIYVHQLCHLLKVFKLFQMVSLAKLLDMNLLGTFCRMDCDHGERLASAFPRRGTAQVISPLTHFPRKSVEEGGFFIITEQAFKIKHGECG